MATYYVSKAGNDSNNGTSAGTAKLTINAALIAATSSGDVVEIIDEGTYAEGNLWNRAAITLKHTASWIGRPVLDASSQTNALWVYTDGGFDVIGLEIKGDPGTTEYAFKGESSANLTRDLTVSGCLIHSIPILASGYLQNTDSSKPITFDECIMFFEPGSSDVIKINGYTEISNCLITASNLNGSNCIIFDNSARGTASFSTFINRGSGASRPAIACSKVINNIVYTNAEDGIASDDQTYNLVTTPGHAFRNKANDSNAATGSNAVATYAELGFVNGGSVGKTAAVAADFKLTEGAKPIGFGVAYDGVDIDLTGTTRPQGDDWDVGCFEFVSTPPEWTSYTTQNNLNLKQDFTITTFQNSLDTSNHKFKYDESVRTMPFHFGLKGPMNLRCPGREKPYKVEK